MQDLPYAERPATPLGDDVPSPGIAVARYQWDGHGTAVAINWIVSIIVGFVTCGIAPFLGYPAWRARKLNTEFVRFPDGRIKFTETWAESLGRSILTLMLFVVTCGWGIPWIIVWERRAWAERCECPNGTRLKFDGTASEVIGLYILTVFAFLFTLGLATPWLATLWLKWMRRHTVVHQPGAEPYRLRCDAGGIAYLVQAALSLLLVFVTLGLYLPWAIAQWHRWSWSVTSDTRSAPLVVPNGPQTPAQWVVVGAATLCLVGFTALVAAFASSSRGAADAAEDSDFEDGDFMADCDACDLDCDGQLSGAESQACYADFPSAGGSHGATSPPPQAPGTFRLTEFAPLGEIGMLYRHAVARGQAASLRVRGSGGRWTLAVDGSRATAARLAESLGWGAASIQPLGTAPDSLVPAMLTTNVEANIRTGPSTSHEVSGVVPDKSLVVAFLGSLDGTTAEYGRSGTWAYVSASRDDAGWMAGALLEPYQGCVPDAAALMRAAPAVPGFGASPLLLSTSVRREAGWQTVLVAVARDAAQQQSFVGIFPLAGSTCQLGAGQVTTVASYVAQMMFFELTRDAGPTALALGAHPEWSPSPSGHLDWKVYTLGTSGRVIWSQQVANSVLLRRSRSERMRFQQSVGRGNSAVYFPLVVTRGGAESRYAYVGGELALVASP
jgi:hypothetical protein